MSKTSRAPIGSIAWLDLTAPDANGLRDFYTAVTGWKTEAVDMGEYNDWTMSEPESGEAVAGVCHARGQNADLPPQWLVYVIIADLDASLAQCRARGGAVVSGPRDLGSYGRFAVIRDPAGASIALMQLPD